MRELSLSDLKFALSQCADETGDSEFIVVGSLAILGAFPDAPPHMRVSHDIDLYSKSGATPQKNMALYERFGPDTEFAIKHDFYIEPVGEWTTMTSLPGWADRLVKVEAPGGAVGWCLSPLDIAYNKAEAGREKDVVYLAELFRTGIVRPSQIKSAMDAAQIPPEVAAPIHSRIQDAIQRAR